MATNESSLSPVPSPNPSPEEGRGLPRRRTSTPPGVPIPRYPAIDTSGLDADQTATVLRVTLEALNRQLAKSEHDLAQARAELRQERVEHYVSIREAIDFHRDLRSLLEAFHPTTSANAYELLASLYEKYGVGA